jgi:hypothetical protein
MSEHKQPDTDFIPKNGGVVRLPLFKLGGGALAIAAIIGLWNLIIPSKASVTQLQSDMAVSQANQKADHDTITSVKQEIDDMHRWMQDNRNNQNK